ncbi:MAG: magnesium transporter [Bacteroidales bacterium]|nr:magnesium transporter [Bacteroidales bacterium]MCF8334680.1 magnesium transporter [Bacteroidales bacterium]
MTTDSTQPTDQDSKPFELTREYLDNLCDIIEREDKHAARAMMDELHAADIAELYNELTMEQAKFLFMLISDDEKAADVVAELNEDDRERFLEAIPSKVIADRFILNMDSDDAADVMADISPEKQHEVLTHVKDVQQATDIKDLMAYDESSAGGLMGKEYISVNWNTTTSGAIEEIRANAEEVDEVYYVYVVDNKGILKGALSLKDLILAPRKKHVKDLYDENLISVPADMPAAEVSNIANKYDLVALPVVDNEGHLLGRITFDDITDFLRTEAEKDYEMVSGIADHVEPTDSIFKLTKARLPWLLVGLLGGILGARVIGMYESDLAQHASMAFFIPLIAAMGGNVGIQSSSIVVQAIASNSLSIESTVMKVLKELSVALLNGLACSAIIFLYNFFFSDSLALSVSVSAALFLVIIFASIFGTLVPLLLHKYNIDPALATGPFITTANDIIGLLIYLAIGAMIFTII